MFLGISCRPAAGRWHRAGRPLLAALLLAASAAAQCLSGDYQNGTGRQDLGYATYEGSFQNGQPEGQGTMDYGGGDKYVGEWRRGKEHGAGQLYKKGVATVATYYNGVLGLVNERAKAGLYTGEDGKSADGIFITNVYDKNKVRLLKISSSGQQNRLIIKFFSPDRPNGGAEWGCFPPVRAGRPSVPVRRTKYALPRIVCLRRRNNIC